MFTLQHGNWIVWREYRTDAQCCWLYSTPSNNHHMTLSKPCLNCGTLTRTKSRCTPCQNKWQLNQDFQRNRPSSNVRGYDNEWKQLRLKVFALKGTSCVYCNAPATSVDHVIPLSVDASLRLSIDNCVPCCIACNSRKKNRTFNK